MPHVPISLHSLKESRVVQKPSQQLKSKTEAMTIFEDPNLPLGATPDIEYYLEPIIFHVEGTLFRFPREYFAQESAVFLDLFQLVQPVSDGNGPEGILDSNPVALPDTVNLFSFRALLKLLYPDVIPVPGLTRDELIALLEITRMWDMDNVRNIVVQHLGPLLEDDPAQKWSLGKTYEVHEWIGSALEKLIRRNEPLGEKEFQLLDQETILKIAAIRESPYPVFRDADGYYGSYSDDTTIVRWEVREGRGPINIDLSSVAFNLPSSQVVCEIDEDQDQDEVSEEKKDADFYFELVVFKVDDRLYKVFNQPFIQYSPIFRRRFEKRGYVEYNYRDPYIVEAGVSTTDFTNLLRFFFPPKLTSEREPTQEEWISILRLSTKWGMQELKSLAIEKLGQTDFEGDYLRKLQVARELDIAEWFLSGIKMLITRNEPLTALEYQILNQELILQVLDLRERAHQRYCRNYGRTKIILRSERGELPPDYDLADRLATFNVA